MVRTAESDIIRWSLLRLINGWCNTDCEHALWLSTPCAYTWGNCVNLWIWALRLVAVCADINIISWKVHTQNGHVLEYVNKILAIHAHSCASSIQSHQKLIHHTIYLLHTESIKARLFIFVMAWFAYKILIILKI